MGLEELVSLLKKVIALKDELIAGYEKALVDRDALIEEQAKLIESYKKRVAILEGRKMPDYE
jgi:hypothetical protein